MPYNFTMTADEVVQVLYKHLLGRDADSGQGWAKLIVEGNDPTMAIKGILESEEYKMKHPEAAATTLEKNTNSLNHQRIFFFHNPKAAGTSIMHMIEKETGHLQYSPLIANTICTHAALDGRYDAFRGYDIYMGHYGRDVFEAVRDGHVYITNFRHPVSRVVSLYNYFRFSVSLKEHRTSEEEVDFACVKAAKELSFRDFLSCNDPHVRIYISNYHFRQLTSSPWVLEPQQDSLNEAFSFIDGMLCYYVCEYRELSLRRFRNRLGLETLPTENVSFGNGAIRFIDLDNEMFGAIMEMNRLDMEIYRYAVNALLADA